MDPLRKIPNNCIEHLSKPLEMYCDDCKMTLCNDCVTQGAHANHKCMDIKKAAAELSQKTETEVIAWSNFKTETEAFVKSIDLAIDDFRAQILKTRTDIEKNDEAIESLLEGLDILETQRVRELERMRDEGKQEMLMLDSLERHWNEVKARGSDCDVVQAAISLQNKSEQVVMRHNKQLFKDTASKSQRDSYRLGFDTANSSAKDKGKNVPRTVRETTPSNQGFNQVKETSAKENQIMKITHVGLYVRNPKGELNIKREKIRTSRSSRRKDKTLCPDWNGLTHNATMQTFTLEIGKGLRGIAVHKGNVYMTSYGTPYILVLSLQNLSTVYRLISVPDLIDCTDLVFNESDFCLYACNFYRPRHIYKINTLNDSVTSWPLKIGYPSGLSISKQKNLLVSYSSCGQIDEFSGSGKLVRSIQLEDGITGTNHVIEVEEGKFIVCQLRPICRICLLDSLGRVIRSYGEGRESGVGQLSSPHHIELDQKGNILVADFWNHKLRILTSDLRYVADVNITDEDFRYPTSTCWDKENNRLLVTAGEGRFYVVTSQNY